MSKAKEVNTPVEDEVVKTDNPEGDAEVATPVAEKGVNLKGVTAKTVKMPGGTILTNY